MLIDVPARQRYDGRVASPCLVKPVIVIPRKKRVEHRIRRRVTGPNTEQKLLVTKLRRIGQLDVFTIVFKRIKHLATRKDEFLDRIHRHRRRAEQYLPGGLDLAVKVAVIRPGNRACNGFVVVDQCGDQVT